MTSPSPLQHGYHYHIYNRGNNRGGISDRREWPYSSCHAILSDKQTHIARGAVLDWFGSAEKFRAAHQTAVNKHQVPSLVPDDFD